MLPDPSREGAHVLATLRQRLPVAGQADVTPLVVADLLARSDEGTAKYGTPLQTHNGRDAIGDAYQEALDLCQYLRQAIEERNSPDPYKGIGPEECRLLRSLAVSLLDGLAKMPTGSIALPEGTAEVFDEWVRTYAVDDRSLEPIFVAATTASTRRPYRDKPQITRIGRTP